MSSLPAERLIEPLAYAPEPRADHIDFTKLPPIPDLSIDNLDELARIIRTMTYGELTTLASEAGISAPHLHGWSMK